MKPYFQRQLHPASLFSMHVALCRRLSNTSGTVQSYSLCKLHSTFLFPGVRFREQRELCKFIPSVRFPEQRELCKFIPSVRFPEQRELCKFIPSASFPVVTGTVGNSHWEFNFNNVR
jgi:hypothetical protein